MNKVDSIALIPCYNVEKYCEQVITTSLQYVSYVIAIDDGSTDQTNTILKKLEKHSEHFKVITEKQNYGKGHALLTGFHDAINHFDFNALITLDADAQHPPQEITKLIGEVQKGADLVIGSRDFTQMPMRSRHSNAIISFLLRRIFPDAPKDTQSGMRAFSKNFVTEIAHSITGGRYEMEFRTLLYALKHNKKIRELTIPTIYINDNKSSHFSPLRDSIRILKVLILYLFGKL